MTEIIYLSDDTDDVIEYVPDRREYQREYGGSQEARGNSQKVDLEHVAEITRLPQNTPIAKDSGILPKQRAIVVGSSSPVVFLPTFSKVPESEPRVSLFSDYSESESDEKTAKQLHKPIPSSPSTIRLKPNSSCLEPVESRRTRIESSLSPIESRITPIESSITPIESRITGPSSDHVNPIESGLPESGLTQSSHPIDSSPSDALNRDFVEQNLPGINFSLPTKQYKKGSTSVRRSTLPRQLFVPTSLSQTHDTDPIEDSPFSFPTKGSVLDISNWLSSDDDSPLPSIPKKLKPKQTQPYTPAQLKHANRVTRKREELHQEMVINVASCIELDLEKFENSNSFESDIPAIYWQRNVTADYVHHTDTFIPCKQHTITEKNLVLLYKPEQFFDLAVKGTLSNVLKSAVALLDIPRPIPIIIVLEGYDKYVQLLKTAENHRFRNQVTESPRKKRKSKYDDITTTYKEIEHLLNKTQFDLGVNIFPVKTSVECIDWLYTFTYTIASSMYDKFQRNIPLANLGTVKSGSDVKGTVIQALRQFRMMTVQKAETVQNVYGSMYGIYKEYERSGTLGRMDGKNLVPPSVDAALRKVFLGDDDTEVIF